jgi:hypothetical protein
MLLLARIIKQAPRTVVPEELAAIPFQTKDCG